MSHHANENAVHAVETLLTHMRAQIMKYLP